MKKVFYFFTVSLLLGFMSCSSEDDFYGNEPIDSGSSKTLKSVTDPSVGTTTTLNLSNDLLIGGISTTGGVYWGDTYTPNTNIVSDIFTFSHSSMFDMYSYWDGFTVSNANDITNYGGGHSGGGSDGWVAHQWSCMPGSGVNTAGTITPGQPGQSGAPFIVAYWSSYMDPKNPGGKTFSESTYSNWIKIGERGQYQITGLNIANHPWPYYGNKFGDGFARPLDQVGDFFYLYIYGVDASNKISDSPVIVKLADNPTGNLVQIEGWENIPASKFSGFGNVKYLLFQMDSKDADPTWGINTAAYFCLDKLQVKRMR